MLVASVDAGLGIRAYSGSCDEPACIGEDYLTQTFDVEANVEYKFLVSGQGFDLGSSFYISIDVQEVQLTKEHRFQLTALCSCPFHPI